MPRPRARLLLALSWSCLTLGCAASSTTPASQPTPLRSASASPQSAAGDARELGSDPTFADLARAARLLLREGRADAQAGCLLERGAAGLGLRADLSSGLEELPEPPTELDPQLGRSRGVHVLSTHGIAGDPTSALVLASFTTLPASSARAPMAALIVTDQGVYLRGPAQGAGDALSAQEAAAQLAGAPGLRGAVVFVSAEASVALVAVYELLRALPRDTLAALSVALPEGTRLPEATAGLVAGNDCPDGLPEPAPDATEGALDPQSVLSAIGPLRERAQACLDAARGPGRAGGRLKLGLRIDSTGRASHACAVEDGVGDPGLLGCVLEQARALAFSAPSPPGFVDVHLPLGLTPAMSSPQRPVCER